MLRDAFGVTLFGILMTPVSSTSSAALSDGERRPGRCHDRWVVPRTPGGETCPLRFLERGARNLSGRVVCRVGEGKGDITDTAAHNAVGLAGESPVVGVDCLPM